MDPETKERLSDRSIWVRGLYTLLFVVIYSVAETILSLLAIFQFIAALVTGHVNDVLLRFGTNLSRFIYQILQFVTFNDETVPFPFSDWPDEEVSSNSPWVKTTDANNTDASNTETVDTSPTPVADEPADQTQQDIPANDASDDPDADSPDDAGKD